MTIVLSEKPLFSLLKTRSRSTLVFSLLFPFKGLHRKLLGRRVGEVVVSDYLLRWCEGWFGPWFDACRRLSVTVARETVLAFYCFKDSGGLDQVSHDSAACEL